MSKPQRARRLIASFISRDSVTSRKWANSHQYSKTWTNQQFFFIFNSRKYREHRWVRTLFTYMIVHIILHIILIMVLKEACARYFLFKKPMGNTKCFPLSVLLWKLDHHQYIIMTSIRQFILVNLNHIYIIVLIFLSQILNLHS